VLSSCVGMFSLLDGALRHVGLVMISLADADVHVEGGGGGGVCLLQIDDYGVGLWEK